MNSLGWIFISFAWSAIICLTIFCFYKVLFTKKKEITLVTAGDRARWGSRLGLILAMAGNAIGLGNFLRFPVQAAANGGGAFMIPYFCAFLLLGIPLMWVEWGIGRYGGAKGGHGTTPGMFNLMWKHPAAKYIGSLGMVLPFTVVVYYVFIESWTLAFSWYSATGAYFGSTSREAMGQFLQGYQGVVSNQHFSSLGPALIFLAITLAINYFFLYKGLSKGIEILAKIGMPVLFLFAIILVIRVLTLGTPDPAQPEWNVMNGLAFIWKPDFGSLSKASVWLAAAGQIFFTLSLGQGMVCTYASYVRETEDVALNGLSTCATNEFAEVVLGGTIAIPVAVAFFGLAETKVIASQGAFNLGFQSLPVIFQKIPLGQMFGAMWFFLLFIAGITSSVALSSPAIAFFEDELKWKRSKAVNVTFAFQVFCTLLVVIFLKHGFLDELDFWGGTFGLVVFAIIEVIVFAWIFGIDKGWEELHKGADIKIPVIFKFIMKYITPLYILIILVAWFFQNFIGVIFMKGVLPENAPYVWLARGFFLLFILIANLMVYFAWKKKKQAGTIQQ